MRVGSPFKLFVGRSLDELTNTIANNMRAEVRKKPDNYILNVGELEFSSYLTKSYSLENLDIKFDDVFISHEEHLENRTIAIKYHIPFTGDTELLRCTPNLLFHWTITVTVDDNCICFELVTYSDNPGSPTREANDIMDSIRQQATNVINQVDVFNQRLPNLVSEAVQNRKQEVLKKNDFISSLGVPIKAKENFPTTFTIPNPPIRKKIQIAPPAVKEKNFRPDPTLDNSVYYEILKIVHDVGKQFERMPSTYSNKGEEDLRDHILLFLEPRFEGSATGETFNKTGKTDILLRYEGMNVFIAECKFWKGIKSFYETITQLLGYLTWRDSKAAVIIFVKNKDFTSILNSVKSGISSHPNYLGYQNEKEETWLNYQFHLIDDTNREVRLAVLLFHIPQ